MTRLRRNMWIGLGIGVAAAATLATCSEDTVSELTARSIMRELTDSIDSAMVDNQVQDRVITVGCAQSGTKDVTGHVAMASNPLAVDAQLRITYRQCRTRDNKVFDGHVDFTQSLTVRDPMRVTTRYQGNVEVTGAVVADCPIDVEFTLDEQGRSLEVQGNLCHRDARDLDMDMTVTPLWKR